MAPLQAIIWSAGDLKIINQLLLPFQTTYITITCVQQGWDAIKKMQVRGAPAIAIAGCLSLAAELHHETNDAQHPNTWVLYHHVSKSLDYLVTARPTAVNLKAEATKLKRVSQALLRNGTSVADMKREIIEWCVKLLADDVAVNLSVGDNGMKAVLEHMGRDNYQKASVITICNTGSLATAGYGTALGVVRSLHGADKLESVFMLETRPYLQGARLSALEAVVEKWPGATLLCDGAVGALLCFRPIDGAVVGADRVAANGDTANKIGTYQLAVLCAAHSVPFFVCAPSSSVDLSLANGNDIIIEHRPDEEMTSVRGVRVAAPGINCWNPAFDLTPARLITGGIVTEFGVFRPDELKEALLRYLATQPFI